MCSMRMLSTSVNEQLLVHLATKPVLRKHPFYSPFNDLLRTTLDQILGDLNLLPTRIATNVLVFLVLELVSGENHFLCIDYDNEVSAINVGRIIRFVLSAQY